MIFSISNFQLIVNLKQIHNFELAQTLVCVYIYIIYQFSSWFKTYGVKVLSFLIQKFSALSLSLSLSVSLNLRVSVHISQMFNYYKFAMFTECMFIVIKMFACFYGVWFFMSFMWLFSLILNDVSDFPTY